MLDIRLVDARAAHAAADANSRAGAMSTATPLFRNRSFLRLWFVAAATQVGGHMALYAMTILVFSTTRSNTAVSALLMTYMLPQVLLSPFAGVIIDRVDLRWAMIAPNAVRAALMVGLALAGFSIPMLLLLNIGISLTSVVLMPAEGSMVPRVVPAEQLETALGIFNLTFQASFAVGFAFAGPLLVVVFGPSIVLAVVAAFYVAATAVCMGLPPAAPEARRADHLRRSDAIQPIRELLDGFRVIPGTSTISGRSSCRPQRRLGPASSVCWVRRWRSRSASSPPTSPSSCFPWASGSSSASWGCAGCGAPRTDASRSSASWRSACLPSRWPSWLRSEACWAGSPPRSCHS